MGSGFMANYSKIANKVKSLLSSRSIDVSQKTYSKLLCGYHRTSISRCYLNSVSLGMKIVMNSWSDQIIIAVFINCFTRSMFYLG